jgi:hypothetical protein
MQIASFYVANGLSQSVKNCSVTTPLTLSSFGHKKTVSVPEHLARVALAANLAAALTLGHNLLTQDTSPTQTPPSQPE